MSWSWIGFRRVLFGWEKFDSLEQFIASTSSINDMLDYAKQHFTWEEDRIAEDEWQEPNKAFLNLQSRNTPADCDDFTTVFNAWFQAKGYASWMIAVWNATEGHAVCVYSEGDYLYYADNFFRPRIRFNTIQQICFDIYPDAKIAKYARWSSQQKRYVYTENINLKAT